MYPNFHQANHPLVLDKLSKLREKNTDHREFRELLYELSLLLGYEATATLKITNSQIDTPLESCSAPVLLQPYPVILPILRAGLGMVDGLLSLMPQAKVGHIGLFRDEKTLEPQKYYFKIPQNTENSHYFVCDPMLATAGSAIYAMHALKEKGIKNITLICIVAAPEGVKRFCEAHPDVELYVASVDRELGRDGYIRPGLGDAGDRLFGTI